MFLPQQLGGGIWRLELEDSEEHVLRGDVTTASLFPRFRERFLGCRCHWPRERRVRKRFESRRAWTKTPPSARTVNPPAERITTQTKLLGPHGAMIDNVAPTAIHTRLSAPPMRPRRRPRRRSSGGKRCHWSLNPLQIAGYTRSMPAVATINATAMVMPSTTPTASLYRSRVAAATAAWG